MTAPDQRLRDALRSAPSAPEAPGYGFRLAERARRRRGIRRAGAAAGVIVACVSVVGGALALNPTGSTSPRVVGPTPSPAKPTTQAPSLERLDCSRPPQAPIEGAPAVPEGAVSARLCGGLADNAGFNLVWPADTLHGEHVNRLVQRLNRLEPYVEPESCTLPLNPPFDLVLLYPDASKVWVHGDTSGTCAHVAVQGGRVWAGADSVLRSALALIGEHRAAAGSRATIEPARCPRRWNDVSYTAGAEPVAPGSPAAITACRYLLDRPDRGTITQSAEGVLDTEATVEDPPSFLREVAGGSRTSPCGGAAYDLGRTQDLLLVRDANGDVQVVSTTACWPNELTGVRRYPSEALADAVADLLA